MHPRKILHPTDYTEVSEPALHVAADLAHEHGADLVLLHAVESLGPENVPAGEAMASGQPEGMRKWLLEQLHHKRPADSQLHVEYVLSEEDPVTAILRTAEICGCDLIVLSTHGVTGWKRWVLGSTAEEVVRRANCPVLVVKQPGQAAPLPPLQPTPLHPGYLVEREEPEPMKSENS